ncbi:hypothetical protein GGX14DRAFT_391227 [Mycena pura]|uniref:Uncharacterized protein n=1 Tax=Mycena pura TaxID=153505 RepID=A0AAD6VLD2_9AGAR|nr:hypothetical protein GGX14DRAFT_391227 [Mycena pura]
MPIGSLGTPCQHPYLGGRYSDAAVDDVPDLDNTGITRTKLKPADGVQVTMVRSAMTVVEYWCEGRSDRNCKGSSVFAGLGLPRHGTGTKEGSVFAGLDYPEYWFEVAHRRNGRVREGEWVPGLSLTTTGALRTHRSSSFRVSVFMGDHGVKDHLNPKCTLDVIRAHAVSTHEHSMTMHDHAEPCRRRRRVLLLRAPPIPHWETVVRRLRHASGSIELLYYIRKTESAIVTSGFPDVAAPDTSHLDFRCLPDIFTANIVPQHMPYVASGASGIGNDNDGVDGNDGANDGLRHPYLAC